MPPVSEDGFVRYFQSDLHNKRQAEALQRTVDRLTALGQNEFLSAFSEAIGMIYGIAHFYKHLGMKHQGAKVLWSAANWIKKGT